jgi:hypothetical protein
MNDKTSTDGHSSEPERLGDKTTLRCVICNRPFRGDRHSKPLGDPNLWRNTSIGVCPDCQEKHGDSLLDKEPPRN